MTALHPAVVCAIVLCLAFLMFTVSSHLAIRVLERDRHGRSEGYGRSSKRRR